MSDTTDDMECRAAAWEAHKEHKEELMDKYIWTQSNGVEIKVKDMTTSHVQNSLNAINKGMIFFSEIDKFEHDNWIRIFTNELNKRNQSNKMKKASVIFIGTQRVYTYDTEENLQKGEVYTSPSYPGKHLLIDAIEQKDENAKPPTFVIKELIIGDQPDIPKLNGVYIKKVEDETK